MPVQRGSDSGGPYYRWGSKGKKYHYESGNPRSAAAAKASARRQGKAAHADRKKG